MRDHIRDYIKDKEFAWAPTTQKSEQYRLSSLSHSLDGDPARLWQELSKLKPYSRITTWTRVCAFWEWMIANGRSSGPNLYKVWREKNARIFKNAYQPKYPTISFEEAVLKVKGLKDKAASNLALQILGEGTRWSECQTEGSDPIIGKSASARSRYRPDLAGPTFKGSYASFRRALGDVGIRPHDLRKLCATRLVSEGLKEADLLKVMGWTSMETAKFYLAPKADSELREVFGRIHKDLT